VTKNVSLISACSKSNLGLGEALCVHMFPWTWQVPVLAVKDLTTMTRERFLLSLILMVAIERLDYCHFIQTGT
jgi:hypothetical protein